MNKIIARKELVEIYGITHILKTAEPKAAESPRLNPQDLENLKSSLQGCTKCALGKTRKNIVFGTGSPHAKLMFVGEGPGADEDEQGEPFVGKAGQLLTKMIAAMGFTRDEVYIANIVKCRPPGNRQPVQVEADACIGYLRSQIELVNPKVIVCLGATAVQYLLNLKGISKVRGTFQKLGGAFVMPTFHPAYLLRDPSKKKEAWEDLKAVMAALKDN